MLVLLLSLLDIFVIISFLYVNLHVLYDALTYTVMRMKT